MPREKQTDYRISRILKRKNRSVLLLKYTVIVRQSFLHRNGYGSAAKLAKFGTRYLSEKYEEIAHINMQNHIFALDFSFIFNRFTDLECLVNFCFAKHDISRSTLVIFFLSNKSRTSRNRYGATPILSAFVVLRKMAAPIKCGVTAQSCLKNGKVVYQKYSGRLSKTFLIQSCALLRAQLTGISW